MFWGFNRVVNITNIFCILILVTKVDLRPQRVKAWMFRKHFVSYVMINPLFLQATCQQYESMTRNSEDFNNEAKTLERKVKLAEDT
jgi:hypothetical protein